MPKRRTVPTASSEPAIAKPVSAADSSGNELLTTRDLMDYLQVSRTKVWELVRDKTNPLPAFKLGGDYRYRRAEVDAWMESLRVRPEEEQ